MKNITLFVLLMMSVSLSANSQTENYQVYAIKFASTAHSFPISAWADRGPEKDSIQIDFMIWLIKGRNSRNILVDAGFLNDLQTAKDFGVKDYVRPDSMLSKLSLKAGDITDIIFSHPHWDHIDGVDLFPNAQIWIQKEDFNYFVSTAWQKGGNHGGFDRRDVRKVIDLNLAGKLTLVDGDDKEIIPGIRVYTGSRHTFNSQYALVETGINKIILASDNIWIYYNLDHLRPPPPVGTFDAGAYVTSMQRMKTLASNVKFIIPGHDPKVFSIFPVISAGVVEIK
jgi:glyoxylase-like metal-dependent hydrolase (beta-lactamase superfamily II)